MNNIKDIEEYVQCFNCKGYFPKKEIKKVLAKPSFLDRIQNKINWNLICKGCLKDESH